MHQRIVLATLIASLLLISGVMLAREVRAGNKLSDLRRVLAEYKSGAEGISNFCTSNNYNLPQDKVQPSEKMTDFDYGRTVKLEKPADIDDRRKAIRTMLFGTAGPSYEISEETAAPLDYLGLSDAAADGAEKQLTDIADSYLLRVDMGFGLQSNILHHVPKKPRPEKAIIIFHKGHGSDYPNRFKPLASLIAAGHEVYEVGMPLVKENKVRGLIFESPGFGPVAIRQHDDFWFMDLPEGSPLRYFVEPIVALVDRIKAKDPTRSIVMAGLSGGGWTTVLAAAVEPRIDASIAVAGSWPEYLLTKNMRYPGDYEQVNPDLYRIANRLELYVMAGAGEGRLHLQVFNERDSCCFAGHDARGYEEVVQRQLQKLGSGTFGVEIDTNSSGHVMGDAAIKTILAAAEEQELYRAHMR